MFEPKYLTPDEFDQALYQALRQAEMKALEHYLNSILDGNAEEQPTHRAAAHQMHVNIAQLEARRRRYRQQLEAEELGGEEESHEPARD